MSIVRELMALVAELNAQPYPLPATPCLHIGPCPDETPAPPPSAAPYASGGTIPASVAASEHQPPPTGLTDAQNPPTDRPHRDTDARWHADEALALAKLAELTTKHSPWAAAQHMDWST